MPLEYMRIVEQNVQCMHTSFFAQNIHGNIQCMLKLSPTVSLQIPRSVHSSFPHPSPTSSIKKLFMMYKIKKNDELIPAQKLEYALFCLHSWLAWLPPIRESPSCQPETWAVAGCRCALKIPPHLSLHLYEWAWSDGYLQREISNTSFNHFEPGMAAFTNLWC